MTGRPGEIRFERSLALDTARDSRALLAYAMNGEALPLQHGYPVRLVVPSWYGVASVKWLTTIELAGRPFDGYFQAEKYWYEHDADRREPVTQQRVRALVTNPGDGQELSPGESTIRGLAWSGAAPIARVQVSINQGPWQQARLIGDRHRHGWQWWELITTLTQPGTNIIRARATDLAGHARAGHPPWNRHGYGNNAIQQVHVQVTRLQGRADRPPRPSLHTRWAQRTTPCSPAQPARHQRAGQRSTTLTLTGAYRPPPGAALDRAVMHQVATATIPAFLHRIAQAIAQPARAGGPRTAAAGPDLPPPPPEPDTP